MNNCNCYVKGLPEQTQFSLHYGAHDVRCPAYRVSLDPVDAAKDFAFRNMAASNLVNAGLITRQEAKRMVMA